MKSAKASDGCKSHKICPNLQITVLLFNPPGADLTYLFAFRGLKPTVALCEPAKAPKGVLLS